MGQLPWTVKYTTEKIKVAEIALKMIAFKEVQIINFLREERKEKWKERYQKFSKREDNSLNK